MEGKHYCTLRDIDFRITDAKKCEFYEGCVCKDQSSECRVIESSELEHSAEIHQPGDWITADTTAQSLRNLRMEEGE